MDDIASKITELLGDKDSVEKITQMASSFMSGSNNQQVKEESNQLSEMQFDPVLMSNMMKMINVLKSNNQDDNNTKLLLALKPHLSVDRRKKVDKAISILKIIKILPLLKESGLSSLFEGL